jgi:hypothetical protein
MAYRAAIEADSSRPFHHCVGIVEGHRGRVRGQIHAGLVFSRRRQPPKSTWPSSSESVAALAAALAKAQSEILFAATRPVILNGIEDVINADARTIAEWQRRPETALWQEFELAHARHQLLSRAFADPYYEELTDEKWRQS